MANEAFTKMVKLVDKCIPRVIASGLSDDSVSELIRKDYDRSTANIRINWMAKLLADEYLKNKSLADIRNQLKIYGGNGRRVLRIEEIYDKGYATLNIDIIWQLHCILLRMDSDQAVKVFSRKFRDVTTTLVINTAFEIATRCIGISYTARDTDLDFKFHIVSKEIKTGGPEHSIVTLLKAANIQVVNRTIILALLPFIGRKVEESGALSSMSINEYAAEMRRNTWLMCSNADKVIFNKLHSFISQKEYHSEVCIYPFVEEEINWPDDFFLTLHHMHLSRKIEATRLEEGFSSNTLAEIVKGFHAPKTEVALNTNVSNMALNLLMKTVDWIWRLRMRWNHDMAVGSALTLAYTNLFTTDRRKLGVSFNYRTNRYLLETIGQAFIGYESYAFDKKCTLLRNLAKAVFDLMYNVSDGNWSDLYSTDALIRIYNSSDSDDADLYAFINTLSIMLKETQTVNLYHVMTAFVFYAKYILKDHALNNIEVTFDMTDADIELWMQYGR